MACYARGVRSLGVGVYVMLIILSGRNTREIIQWAKSEYIQQNALFEAMKSTVLGIAYRK